MNYILSVLLLALFLALCMRKKLSMYTVLGASLCIDRSSRTFQRTGRDYGLLLVRKRLGKTKH